MAIGNAGQKPFGGHAGRVLSVAFRPGNLFLATGGNDGTIRIWDLKTGAQRLPFIGHAGSVRSIAFSPDGTVIASAGDDRTIRIWDADTGKQRALLTGHTGHVLSVAYSRDGTSIASAGDDRTVRIWNAVTGEQVSVLPSRPGGLNSVALSPDGRLAACAGSDRAVWIWPIDSNSAPLKLAGHSSRVNSVAFSPDGTLVASAGADRSVRIWDARTGRERSVFNGRPGTENAVAFSPDGHTVASAGENGDTLLWGLDNGLPGKLGSHDLQVNCIAYGLIGDTAAIATASDDGTARVWEISTGRQVLELTGHTGPVESVAYSPDGNVLATAGADRTVRIWDARTGDPGSKLSHSRPIAAMAYSPNPDGARIITVEEEATVRIWDLATGQNTLLEDGHQDWVRAVACGPDGSEFATASDDETIVIWDAASGARRARLTGHSGPVSSVAYLSDCTLVSGGDDGTVRVWNTRTGKADATLPGTVGPVWSVAAGPTAAGSSVAAAGADGTVVIWDGNNHEQLGRLEGHDGPVYSVAYDPPGSAIATAGSDGTVRLWDAETLTPRMQLAGHTSAVSSVAFSPDGVRIATCGYDGTIRLWDTLSGQQVAGSGLRSARQASLPLAGVTSDSPSVVDLIGVGRDVATLGELIAATETMAPLAIAVIGEWGAGKSSVMKLIDAHIARLAEYSRNNRDATAYATSVSQIHFNAWHYSSDHLWASLAREMFQALSRTGRQVPSPEIDTDTGKLRAEQAQRREELAACERDTQRLTSELGKAKAAKPPGGLLSSLGSPSFLARTFAYTYREGLKDVRKSWSALLTWAVLAAIVAGAWYFFGPQIKICITMAAAVIASFLPALRRGRSWLRMLNEKSNVLYMELDQKRREAEERTAQAQKRLALVDAQFRLSTFVSDRGNSVVYRQGRGLIGDVHEDLLLLSDNLRQARREWTPGDELAEPPERIVLYIDDLDRCPPERVVEMLEAVHLILTLDLFVVVVAVDARWMIRSLESHYHEFFSDGDSNWTGNGPRQATGGNRIAPYDYLDKIFQIPYTLVPPRSSESASYLRSLLPDPRLPTPSIPAVRERGSTGPVAVEAAAVAHEMHTGPVDATQGPEEAGDRDAISDDSSAPSGNQAVKRTEETERAAGSRTVLDLQPPSLRLSHAEVDFMTRLGVLSPSPRAAKRMANLYRLVRISIPDDELAAFLGDVNGGPYRAVQVLLAILTGEPESACEIFERILAASEDVTLLDVLAPRTDGQGTDSDSIARFGAKLREVGDAARLPAVSDYQKWCPELARYSFRTWRLARELARRDG